MLQVLPFPMAGPSQEQLKDPAVFVHEASELWQLWVPLAHSSISTKHKTPKSEKEEWENLLIGLQRTLNQY